VEGGTNNYNHHVERNQKYDYHNVFLCVFLYVHTYALLVFRIEAIEVSSSWSFDDWKQFLDNLIAT